MVSEDELGKICPGMAKELKEYQVGKFLIKSDTYQLRVCRLGMFYPSWKAQLQVGTNISIRKIFLFQSELIICVTLSNMTSATPLSVVLSWFSQRKEGKRGRSGGHL